MITVMERILFHQLLKEMEEMAETEVKEGRVEEMAEMAEMAGTESIRVITKDSLLTLENQMASILSNL